MAEAAVAVLERLAQRPEVEVPPLVTLPERSPDWRRENLHLYLDHAEVPRGYRHCTRESWNPERSPWPERLDRWLEANGSDPDPSAWSLLLWGPDKGAGKTHLATAVFRELLPQTGGGLWITARQLLDGSRGEMDHSRRGRLVERAKTCRLLLLDDLYRERPTAWAIDLLSRVIDHRYSERLPSLITTNRSPTQIRKPPAAVERDGWGDDWEARCSRLLSGMIQKIEGPDARLERVQAP